MQPNSTGELQTFHSDESIRGADDAALVHATLAGCAFASAEIWRRHSPTVRWRLGLSLAGPDLDDQVQDVFARCFEHLGRLRDPSALRSFIIGITLRCGAMAHRRRRLRSWFTLTRTGELPDTFADDDIEGRQVCSKTQEILGRLKPQGRRILELRFVEEQKLTEVADTLGVSLATAKRRLARASAHLRRLARGEPEVVEFLNGSHPTL